MAHLEQEHPHLVDAVERCLESLGSFEDKLDRVDSIDHEQHSVYTGRAFRLAQHLTAAWTLSREGLHASALAIIRTALEHLLADHLLHRGPSFQTVSTEQVEDEGFDALLREWDRQETHRSRSWATVPERTNKKKLRITYKGLGIQGADPATARDLLTPLYFEMDRFSPTQPRPGDLTDDGLASIESREAAAEENRQRWNEWMSWQAIRRNIELNSLFEPRELKGIDVHYAFLSGFVHGAQESYRVAFGRWRQILGSGPGDLCQELVALYIASMSASELRLLASMEDREPPCVIADRHELEQLADRADLAAAHLWFLGGGPHEYDISAEWNRVRWRAWRDEGRGGPVPNLPRPRDEQVPYPPESPAERLAKMHASFSEITTGVTYSSPWGPIDRWR